MQTFTYVAIYFIVWWTVLFAILPFGVRGQHESGEVAEGTDPGAPIRANLLIKALVTSVVAGVVTLLVFWGFSNPWLQEYWS